MNTEFLNSYEPKDERYTSNEEIATIAKELGLEAMNINELCDTRNEVVLHYRATKNNGGMSFEAMLSVTAVIDYYKAKMGRLDRI